MRSGVHIEQLPDIDEAATLIRLCDCPLRVCEGDSLALMRTCGLVKAEMHELLRRPNYIFTITDPRCYSDRWGFTRDFELPVSVLRTRPASVRFEFFPASDKIDYDYLDSDEFMIKNTQGCPCEDCEWCEEEAEESSSSDDESSSQDTDQYKAGTVENTPPQNTLSNDLPQLIASSGDSSAVDSSSTDTCFDCRPRSYQPRSEAYECLVEEFCIWFHKQCKGKEKAPRLEIALRKDLFRDLDSSQWTDFVEDGSVNEQVDPWTILDCVDFV